MTNFAHSLGPAARRSQARALAARLPPLLVAAERMAAVVAAGPHGRRRAGPGYSFWQYRPYESHDGVQLIDWRRSARGDRAYVREREWETGQSVWLWRDGSPSMAFSGAAETPSKRDRADILILAMAALLVRGSEKVALLGLDRVAHSGPGVVHGMAERLVLDELADKPRLASLPAQVELPRHAQLLLIGDFLDPLEEIVAACDRFVQADVRVHLVQVLDRIEETLPFHGHVQLSGLENEATFRSGAIDQLRADYCQRLNQHRQGLRDYCRRRNWPMFVHHTDQPPLSLLLSLHLSMGGKMAKP